MAEVAAHVRKTMSIGTLPTRRVALLGVALLAAACSATTDPDPDGPAREARALERFEEVRQLALAAEALNPTDRQRAAYDRYLTRARQALDRGEYDVAEVQLDHAAAAAARIRRDRIAQREEVASRIGAIERDSREILTSPNVDGVDREALFRAVGERVELAEAARDEGDYELALAAADEARVLLDHRAFAFGEGAPAHAREARDDRPIRRRGGPPISCRVYRLSRH